MPQDIQTANSQMEVLRRRAQMPASSAGIGAELANSLEPTNPIARAGGTPLMSNPPRPGFPQGGGAAGQPTARAVGALREQKSEAQTLIDALIWRLKRITPPQPQESVSAII